MSVDKLFLCAWVYFTFLILYEVSLTKQHEETSEQDALIERT